MARILAIDFGLKRTGIAVTDNLQIIGQPLKTIDSQDIIKFLKEYCSKEQVETIVLGRPIKLDGSEGELFKNIKILAEEIKKICPKIKIAYIDETYTSKMAVQELIKSGAKKKKRRQKGNIDQMSAYLILKDYMVQSGKWNL